MRKDESRRYLNVPYSDKDRVKALDGKWDSILKLMVCSSAYTFRICKEMDYCR